MEPGDLIFFIVIASILLVKFILSMKRRLRTLDISEHELVTEFLDARPELSSACLKPLCPEQVAKPWTRMSLLLDICFFLTATAYIGCVIFADYVIDKTNLKPTTGFTVLFILFLPALGYPTAKNFLNRRRFRNQKIIFGDASERWIMEHEKSSSGLKALVILCFLPLLFIGLLMLVDWEEDVSITYCLFLSYVVVMALYLFRSEQTALGTPGLFDRGSFVPWSKVVEYRWFQDRSALLFIVDRWSTKSPMVIFPVQEQFREDVDKLLQEFAPDKQREDVEPALEKLESSESPTTESSPA